MKLFKPGWINHGFSSKAQKAYHVIYSLDIHPDGSRLATGGLGDNSCGLVVLWNMKPIRDPAMEEDSSVNRKLFQTTNHLACVNCVRWSAKGQYLASAGDDKIIMIWAMTSGSQSRSSSVFGQSEQMTFSETWRCVATLRGHSGDILDLGWSPSTAYLASASVDNSCRVWTVGQWQDSPHMLVSGAEGGGMVKGVTWDPVGRYLATHTEKAVCVWRTSDWAVEKRITKPFKEGAGHTHVLRLSWSPDGSNLIAPQAVNNGFPVAQMILRNNWQTSIDFVGHSKHVVCTRYNPNILTIPKKDPFIIFALGSKDRSVSVWSSIVNRPLVVINDLFTSSVIDLAWSSSGKELVCCSLDGTVAYVKFEEKEIGATLSKDHMVTIHRKTYGQSLFDEASHGKMGGPGSSLILETPEAMALQKEQAKMKAAAVLYQAATKISGPSKQIEIRTKDGKRRITPKFLGHLDEPDETSNPQFSSESMPASTNNTDAVSTTALSTTQEAHSAASGSKEGETKSRAVENGGVEDADLKKKMKDDGNETVRKSIEVSILGLNDKSPKSFKSPAKATKNQKEKSPKKQKEKGRKRKEKHAESVGSDDSDHGMTSADVSSAKRRKRLVIFQEEDDDDTQEGTGGPSLVPTGRKGVHDTDKVAGHSLVLPKASRRLWIPVSETIKAGGKHSAVCADGTLVEAANDVAGEGGTAYHRLVGLKGGQRVWEIPLAYRVNSMAVTNQFICAGDLRGRLHILSSTGSRLLPPLVLDAPLADLHCSAGRVMLITQAATVMLWALDPLKQIMKESAQLILKDPESTYKTSYLTKEGMVVIQLTCGSSYAFNMELGSWLELFDSGDCLRQVAARSMLRLPQGGLLSSAQLVGKSTNSSVAIPHLAGSTKRRVILDFLESQTRCCQVVNSGEEYRFWIKAQVRQLVEDGDEYRLRHLCEDLLGPVHRSAKSAWQDTIVGIPKRDLLRDLLPLFALNLNLQRLYVELKEQLDSVSS